MTINKSLISETMTPHYFVREETWEHELGRPTTMTAAYSFAGDYLGNPDHARKLVQELGITHFETTEPDHCV